MLFGKRSRETEDSKKKEDDAIDRSISFQKRSSSNPNVLEYSDPFDNRVTVWHKDVLTGFQLEFKDKSVEYKNGFYRYFETTDDRGPRGYPAPAVILSKSYIDKKYFIGVLLSHPGDIESVVLDFIIDKLNKSSASVERNE